MKLKLEKSAVFTPADANKHSIINSSHAYSLYDQILVTEKYSLNKQFQVIC